MTPETQARQRIDSCLEAAGWHIQDVKQLNLGAGIGVAVREYLREIPTELISSQGNMFGKLWFQNSGKQTTDLASINMTMLRIFPVPLGPTAEQHELLHQLEVQIDHLDRQEQAVERGIEQCTAQRPNILRATFSGQLVPQDLNDEPNSALLDDLSVKRATLTPSAKVRKSNLSLTRSPLC